MIGCLLLLFNVVIVEIVIWDEFEKIDDVLFWMLGIVDWCGIMLLVVLLELMNNDEIEDVNIG